MGADRLGCAGCVERFVRDVECGLRAAAQQPGADAAGVDDTFDTDDGLEMGLPIRVVEFSGGIEDGDSAGFVAPAALVVAAAGTERLGGDGDCGDRLQQGRLVVLDLNDQAEIGLPGDLEVFF